MKDLTKIPEGYYQSGDKMLPSEMTAQNAVRILLEYLGEDPARDGLIQTPARVLKSLREMNGGYHLTPAKILDKVFEVDHDEMVIMRDIDFVSLCEHHMLPFNGVAHVAYIPQGGKVVGISKLARLVHCFAQRLQVQERMTGEVVDALMEHLKPQGAACIIEAHHSCMSCRGVRVSGAKFITSALRGFLKTDVSARAELMALIGGK